MSRHQKESDNLKGLQVDVYNNDINKALRKLKKKLADDGIFQVLRTREYFQSKGEKRRLDKLAAIRRYKKQRIKDQNNW